jgi:hypothetical protein
MEAANRFSGTAEMPRLDTVSVVAMPENGGTCTSPVRPRADSSWQQELTRTNGEQVTGGVMRSFKLLG